MPNQNSRQADSPPSLWGVHPNYYSRIWNKTIIALLHKINKPWPDEAIYLYLQSLTGFGRRDIVLKMAGGGQVTITLEKGEFICFEVQLARLSGRSRNTIHRLLREFAQPVTMISRQVIIHRLRTRTSEQAQGQKRSRLQTPDIPWPSGDAEGCAGAGSGAKREQAIYIIERNIKEKESRERIALPGG